MNPFGNPPYGGLPPGVPGAPAAPPGGPRPPAPPASMAVYKRELRKAIYKNRLEPEITFLNITAMLDMMTIILVFLLKTMSASSASLPQSSDLTMPKSILSTEANEDGVRVLISKTHVLVDDQVVANVPPDASHGLEAKFKRNGPNDLYITPLASALESARKTQESLRRSKQGGYDALIIADLNTPYRLLVEVLFTLGQTEYSKFHLMVLQGAKAGTGK